MPIQITQSSTNIDLSSKELKKLQNEFDKNHCILLSNFLHPSFLCFIQEQIYSSGFKMRVHKEIGEEYVPINNKIKYLMNFLLNNKTLFKVLEEITGCKKIGNFLGRIYSFMPKKGNFDSWHNDLVEDRTLALSINLSKKIYSGGILQIRNRHSKKIIHEIANTGFGDAVIFRLGEELQHRVTSVTGKVAKTAFAGWFRLKPDYVLQTKTLPQKTNLKVSKEITLNDSIKINEFVFTKNEGDNLTLMNMNNNRYYILNSVGANLWELISNTQNLKKVFSTMKGEYNIAPNILKKDILKQFQELQNVGLIKTLN